jgi:hypothetical protein
MDKRIKELAKPESHIVKWSIPVDPNNFGEPIAQPEQDINILHIGTDVIEEGMHLIVRRGNEIIHSQFYEAPKRKWVGLTGTEINHIFAANVEYPERMCHAIEAALKDKNNAV